MLSALKFVQGAVARKDFVAALTHFRIKDNQVQGYNGTLSLCGPIPLDLECMPKATQFIKAIQTCRETISMHLTQTGRLSIKSGAFKVLVDCVNEGFPEFQPEGEEVALKGSILDALKVLKPFIAEDASRQWARGILLRGQSAFATNNIVVVEKWLGHTMPVDINIPQAAVTEILRIGEDPTSMQVTDNSVTFHFSGHRWLRTQLYSTQWPDLDKLLSTKAYPVPFPDGFFEALEDLHPFENKLGQCHLNPGKMSTEASDDLGGSSVDVPAQSATGIYSLGQLRELKGVADQIDFTCYPKPCIFYGDKIRGAIVGMRA